VKMIRTLSALLLVSWFVVPSWSWAMRCQGRVVSVGDKSYEVLAKCGPPSYVERRYEDRLEVSRGGLYIYDPVERRYSRPWVVEHVLIEEWTYNFGPHDLLYHLKFENGVLETIRTGPHGF
jgi:hypothetical protein